jgi:hypothetical protein
MIWDLLDFIGAMIGAACFVFIVWAALLLL